MAHILELSIENPIIYLKAYGGVKINGIDQSEVRCDIDSPQLATLVEEDGQVYVTVNTSCTVEVPRASAVEIEKGMGSVKIANIKNKIKVQKILGNLVLFDIDQAEIEKVGGNLSVQKAAGQVSAEKVAGNLTVDDVASIICGKVGGNCRIKNIPEGLTIEKAGGKFLGQSIAGFAGVSKIGGSFTVNNVQLSGDINVGGNIKLENAYFTNHQNLRAGGNIEVVLNENQADTTFKMRSGSEKIKIKVKDDDIEHRGGLYDYQMGESAVSVTMTAGGSVSLGDQPGLTEDVVGDLSDKFEFEESTFSETIQSRIDSATKMADAKIKSTEIRLEQIRERLEKNREANFDLDFGEVDTVKKGVDGPIPHTHRKARKKGASDEERLMILQMLQEKKITVDEAETLFKALEE
ncbi:MAG: hypothetical protein SVP52_09565 [Chloroflexota bacterium]|nr:hypothetical protein [Chloroflexota bacterium]